MATWTTINDTFLEAGKPVRSVDGLALRDNPIAIAKGATGAPKVEAAALDTTTAERDWVLARCATAAVGVVGTYALLSKSTGGDVSAGGTAAGSSLAYARSDGAGLGIPSGTWRAMGNATPSVGIAASATVFLRIA